MSVWRACTCQYGGVRIVGSVSLVVAATLIGLFGTFMLGVSGLTVAGPGLTVIEYSDSDDSERSIGIGMGIIALAVWLILLASVRGVGGAERRTPDAHAACHCMDRCRTQRDARAEVLVAVLATPPPLSEYPLPEWNRA